MMKTGWVDAPRDYKPIKWSGLQFPIRRDVLPKPYIVVDECGMPDHTKLTFPFYKFLKPIVGHKILYFFWLLKRFGIRDAWRTIASKHGIISIKVIDDQDDPDHTFLTPDSWFLFPNKRKLSDWYNQRYRKTVRLAERRAVSYNSGMGQMLDNEWLAINALRLQKLIIDNPFDQHIVGNLDWSPTGQVWKDGERWVVVKPLPDKAKPLQDASASPENNERP